MQCMSYLYLLKINNSLMPIAGWELLNLLFIVLYLHMQFNI